MLHTTFPDEPSLRDKCEPALITGIPLHLTRCPIWRHTPTSTLLHTVQRCISCIKTVHFTQSDCVALPKIALHRHSIWHCVSLSSATVPNVPWSRYHPSQGRWRYNNKTHIFAVAMLKKGSLYMAWAWAADSNKIIRGSKIWVTEGDLQGYDSHHHPCAHFTWDGHFQYFHVFVNGQNFID